LFTIEFLQTELSKSKTVLAVNIAKRYELNELLNSADVNIAKIKGRMELLNEQIECCKKQADEQGA